jgi:penicillin-binding protein 1A
MSVAASNQIGQHFADWVIDQVSSYVGYADQDLVVQTTLDPALQKQAEQTLTRVLAEQGPAMKASQGALVTMRPDGAVMAMVGGTDYRGSQFNRATQAQRQPGSAFKAFVFLTAFENGYVPGNLFVDGPIRVGKWSPGNYQDRYYGKVTLRDAFARSLKSVAVQLSEKVGRGKVIDTAHRLGITEPLDNNPAIALASSWVNWPAATMFLITSSARERARSWSLNGLKRDGALSSPASIAAWKIVTSRAERPKYFFAAASTP